MDALSIASRSSSCEMAPRHSQPSIGAAVPPCSARNDPAILIGQSIAPAAYDSADKFLALSHSLPALRMTGCLGLAWRRTLSAPFQIAMPFSGEPMLRAMTSRKLLLGATQALALSRPSRIFAV